MTNSARIRHARALFAGIAPEYRVDGRGAVVRPGSTLAPVPGRRVGAPGGDRVLDVASGTGLVARALEARSYG